jgi:hypothetical protein
MNDLLGGFFILLVIAIVSALVLAHLKIITIPAFLLPPVPVPESKPVPKCDNRLGVSYKPSSNVAPNTIISKMNVFFDDMKPMLCTNSNEVNKQFSEYNNDTCSQVKEKLSADLTTTGSFFKMSDSVKNKLTDLNNTMVDSVCGSDNKLDMAKATILGSDIKGMFC